jgi:dihydrodipicolinate synthase/N-acetylneuraminate lyase
VLDRRHRGTAVHNRLWRAARRRRPDQSRRTDDGRHIEATRTECDMDCQTLLHLGGDERAFTLLYMHGFISGKTNLMPLPTDELAAATDRVIDHCIDKPNDKLLQVFERASNAR